MARCPSLVKIAVQHASRASYRSYEFRNSYYIEKVLIGDRTCKAVGSVSPFINIIRMT